MSGKGGQFIRSQNLCEMITYESPVAPLKVKLMVLCFLKSIIYPEVEAQSGYMYRHKGLLRNT